VTTATAARELAGTLAAERARLARLDVRGPLGRPHARLLDAVAGLAAAVELLAERMGTAEVSRAGESLVRAAQEWEAAAKEVRAACPDQFPSGGVQIQPSTE
jgi:hypothetical protein